MDRIRVSRSFLYNLAKTAECFLNKKVVVVARGDEATSCCSCWHEYAEDGRTVCKHCYREVEPIYLDHDADVPAWEKILRVTR